MLHDILFALWFLLPAALANSAPIFAAKIPGLARWNTPVDGGRMWHGIAIFGPHKTWRGIASGVVVATVILWLQQLAVAHTAWGAALTAPEVDYAALPVLLLGPLFGIGALGGDAIESFFKRRRGIDSGGTWLPWDQLDYIIGGVLVSLPFVVLRPAIYIWIVILWFGLHLLASRIGFALGLKEKPI